MLAHLVSNVAFALQLEGNLQKQIKCDGRLTARYGLYNFHMVHSTLAHAQTNYYVSQFGQ
jgi:hypothetical protein